MRDTHVDRWRSQGNYCILERGARLGSFTQREPTTEVPASVYGCRDVNVLLATRSTVTLKGKC